MRVIVLMIIICNKFHKIRRGFEGRNRMCWNNNCRIFRNVSHYLFGLLFEQKSAKSSQINILSMNHG